MVAAAAALLAVVLAVLGPLAPVLFGSSAPSTSAGAVLNRSQSADSSTAPADDSVDVDSVVSQVSHRIVPSVQDPDVLTVDDPRYSARFERSGFSLAPPGSATGETSFAVSLHSVTRGSDVPLSAGAWTADGNSARRVVASGVTERVTAHDATVEWDVVLDRAPAGTGNLTVTAEITGAGATPARAAATGLEWSVDGHTVSMGEMVIKDAGGNEVFRALPRATSSGVALDVPAAVLDTADYPLTIDPVVSPEFPVIAVTGAAGDQYNPDAAFDGTNHLVVWRDQEEAGQEALVAARVAPDGTVIDVEGIRISTGADPQSPSVGFDGTNYLVVFTTLRPDGDMDVRGVRVSPAGVVMGAGEFPIANGVGPEASPRVAFGSTSFLVAWRDSNKNTADLGDIYSSRVTTSGTVLNPGGLPVAVRAGAQTPTDIAFDGTNFLVVHLSGPITNEGSVYGARVNASGVVLDPAGIDIDRSATDALTTARVAVVGSNFLVVWDKQIQGNDTSEILGARVTFGGVVLGTSDIAISQNASFNYEPDVKFDGTNAVVVWWSSTDWPTANVLATRVSPAGAVLDPAGISVTSSGGAKWATQPILSFDGTNVFAVWHQRRPLDAPEGLGTLDIRGVRLAGAGRLPDGPSSLISTGPTASSTDVAFDGTNHLVVWTDERRAPQSDIYAARVNASGTMLDAGGILISGADGDQRTPSVAFDGTNFLVAWDDFRGGSHDIYGARISPAGTVLDPTGRLISAAAGDQMAPAVSFNGTNYLVAWEDHRSGTSFDIYGTRVTPAGAVLSAIPMSTAAGDQTKPAVASDGTQSLVVWQDGRSSTKDIFSTRITAAGGVSAPTGIAISTAAGDQLEPSVAWNGSRYLVAWSDRRSNVAGDIYGSRVSATNVVQDVSGIPISTAADGQSEPSVAANGLAFLVVWTDRRSGNNTDVYGGRVTDAGEVPDGAGFAISTGPKPEMAGAVAKGPGNSWLTVSRRARPTGPNDFGTLSARKVAPK